MPRPLGPDSDLVCSDLERIVWIKTQLLRESGRRPSGRPACSRRGPGELRAAIAHRRQVDGGRAPAGRACRSAAAAIRSGGRQTRRAAAAPRPQRVVGVGDRALVPPRPRVVMVETLQTRPGRAPTAAGRRYAAASDRGLEVWIMAAPLWQAGHAATTPRTRGPRLARTSCKYLPGALRSTPWHRVLGPDATTASNHFFLGMSGGPIQRGICASGHRCYRTYPRGRWILEYGPSPPRR